MNIKHKGSLAEICLDDLSGGLKTNRRVEFCLKNMKQICISRDEEIGKAMFNHVMEEDKIAEKTKMARGNNDRKGHYSLEDPWMQHLKQENTLLLLSFTCGC